MSAQPWIGPQGQQARRLEMHLSTACSQRCLFCSESERMAAFRPYPVTWGRAARVLREQAARGITAVHFTGGEPTLHPRLPDLLRLARKLGMRTAIGTNGAVLSRERGAARLLPWLDEVMLSLHGSDAAVHDAMTSTRHSFERVVVAFERARGRAQANIVVTQHNLSTLSSTVALARELGAGLIIVSNLSPEGRGLEHYAELAVPLPELRQAIAPAVAAAEDVSLRFFGVPMCLLGEHVMLSNDLYWDPRVTVEWTRAPGRVVYAPVANWRPDRGRVKVTECEGCPHLGVCGGVFQEYANRWPTRDLGWGS